MKHLGLACALMIFAQLPLLAQMDSLALASATAELEHVALKGLQADKVAYFKPMAPSLEDCRAVFKAGSAELVHLECKNGLENANGELSVAFVDFKVSHYTTAALKSRPEFLASQQREMREHILPNLDFFQISFIDPETSVSIRYLLKVQGRWVLFADPWKAFVTQD